MPPVSVTIIACDEADRIAEALASVAWAAEALVLDSGSRDATVELARAAGARVVVEGWPGFGAQKNRAAELARHDWVLSLDADERVDERLSRSITALPDEPSFPAYRMRRRNHLGGRPIRHWPWSWDRTTRLYDRRRARFSEPRVHETLEVDGPVGALAGVLEHLTYRDWHDYRRRRARYACLGAEEAARRGRGPRSGDLVLRPTISFLRHWLARGYLLGGGQGLRLSLAAAAGTRMKYQELRRLSGSAGYN